MGVTEEEAARAAAQLAYIGQIASSWASFELAIDVYALELAGFPKLIGLCFTAQVAGPARKLDAYIAVMRERGATEFLKELNKLAEKIKRLAERRNRAVHDPWITLGQEVPRRLEITARGNLKRQMVPVSKDEMLKLIDDIQKCRIAFKELHERIMASFAA